MAIVYVTNGWIGAGSIAALIFGIALLQGRQIRARERRCYEERRRLGGPRFP